MSCIDQNNLEERSQQVQKMWNIYGNATQVLRWLGSSDEDSKDVLALIMELHEYRNDPGCIEAKIKDPGPSPESLL